MTVAVVVLAASSVSALADVDGTPAVRRIADTAWAGGAMPVIVVTHDPDGSVAAVLATAEASLMAPPPGDMGPGDQMAAGINGARGLVAATTAALVWPDRMAWADAETVTTLIEAHGDDPACILRPAYGGEAGWPVLVPVSLADRLAGRSPAQAAESVLQVLAAAGVRTELVETGDPGTTHDLAVSRSALPPFDGPPRPEDGVNREWGAPAADQHDDVPPAGPARVARPGDAG